jgi:hypothetical protein
MVSPAPPAGLSTSLAPNLMNVQPKAMMTPESSPDVEGGHSLAASLGKRFDGSVETPTKAELKSAGPIFSGTGGSASMAEMPAFRPRTPAAKKGAEAKKTAPAEEPGEEPDLSGPPVMRTPPLRGGAKPEAEDYSYTYLPPAQQSYEFPKGKPPRQEDATKKLLLDLGMRLSAAGAIGYLLLYSNLPYIIGLSRRKRSQ